MDGTFGGGDLISASLAIMLGGTDAELHDKEVSLSTSQITGSQTAVFEYDPADEDPQGDPPGPWDGYSLFTIDLSGVKQDIADLQQQIADMQECWEDVVEALQQYDPDYDPQQGDCPADEVPVVYQIAYDAGVASVTPALGSKFITANGTYYASGDNLDGYDTVVVDVPTWETCIQQIAAKLGLTDPYDCNDIKEAIDEQAGYTIPPDVPFEDIPPILGTNPIEIEDNSYTFKFVALYGTSLNGYSYEWEERNIYARLERPASDPYYDVAYKFRAYVYDKSDGSYITELTLTSGQQGSIGNSGYIQITNLNINYANKTLDVEWKQKLWSYQTETTGSSSTSCATYLDTTTANPAYKVRNS